MTSQIDATLPIAGQPTTASVRNNFLTAANEITTLQQQASGSPFLPLAGGRLEGAIYLHNDPTDAMMPATKGYVDAGGGSGGGGIPEAPADGSAYGRNNGAWQTVLPLAGGQLSGALLLAADPTNVLGAVTKQYADAINGRIMPEAPSDGASYGRRNAAWSAVLPIAGGRVTGTLSVGPAIPATISTTSPALLFNTLNSIGPGSITINAFVDNAATPAWRYASANAAMQIAPTALTGNANLAFYVAPPGAANAAVAWGPGLQLDYLGNVIVAGAPPIPTDALNVWLSSNEVTAKIHYAFNGYVSNQAGGTWKYLTAGYGAVLYVGNDGNLNISNTQASGAAGGAWGAQNLWAFLANGDFSAGKRIFAQGAVLVQSSVGNAFVGSYQTAGTTPSCNGFWNYDNKMYFGNADGNGNPSATRMWLNTGNDLTVAGGLYLQNAPTAMAMFVAGAYRYMQMSVQWTWVWDVSTGMMQWGTPSGTMLSMRTSDALMWNAIGGVAGYGPYADLSDERAKQEVSAATVGMAEIRRLVPINFTREAHAPPEGAIMPDGKEVPALAHPPEIGFSAQQVQPIIPEAVRKVGITLPDGSGGLDDDDPSLGIINAAILAAAVNAIKEIDARLSAGGL